MKPPTPSPFVHRAAASGYHSSFPLVSYIASSFSSNSASEGLRGDTPFCINECKQEQIDIDEGKENRRNHSSSTMALRSDLGL